MILKDTQTTLTPNARLARFLQHRSQAMQTNDSWETFEIFSLDAWLQRLWEACLPYIETSVQLLSTQQELFLWEAIIEKNSTILQTRPTAKLAMQAYENLKKARLSLSQIDTADLPDVAAFVLWANHFEQILEKNHCVIKAELLPVIELWLKKLPLPAKIILNGFDDMTPQLLHFFESLKHLNVDITHESLTLKPKNIKTISFSTLQEELQAMVQYAKHIYETEPTASLTFVIPELGALREKIMSLFESHFQNNIVNVSGGYLLSDAPIIHDILHVLKMDPFNIRSRDLTLLLTSPFINALEELPLLAKFDAELRETKIPELLWSTILKRLPESLQFFYKKIMGWQTLRKTLTDKKTLAEWSPIFHDLFLPFSAENQRSLNSEEYQQMQRWHKLLSDFKFLDVSSTQYHYQVALHYLITQARETLFQKETHDGPLQVLGLLEAAGQTSDYYWIAQSQDDTFPADARPNPFLPRRLQKQYNMPHASSERELEFSQKIISRFNHSAYHVIYSYHLKEDDRDCSISPLLETIETMTNFSFLHPSVPIETMPLEKIIDNIAPPITDLIHAKGGVSIFKRQITCPFQAFAALRLQAAPLEVPQEGLDALERGIIIHAALEFIWKPLDTQTQLLSLNKTALDDLISCSIHTAFTKIKRTLSPILKQLEQQRIFNLLLEWLNMEKIRPPFNVLAREQKLSITVGQLNLDIKMDRIDQLDNGTHLIIDYKTGEVTDKGWEPEKLLEPQLPLYALNDQQTNAIAFGKIHAKDIGFLGISELSTDIEGIRLLSAKKNLPQDWHELKQRWAATLIKTATDFQQGVSTVAPIDNTACEYCKFQSLCRIKEVTENL